MPTDCFELEFDVRDYECDMEGIVNNAVYQNYLEHARHVFLKQHHIDFAVMARQGIHLIVVRVEIDYKHPLRAGDRFVVGVTLERPSRVRFGFRQDIYRLPDRQPILNAYVIGAALNERGRPFIPDELTAMCAGTPAQTAD
jgi:acyl-CoA thioester hydrolase